MVRPGAGPKDMWGKLGSEPWYKPYLLRLDNARQEQFFRDMISKFALKCLLLTTGVESTETTHKRMLKTLASSRARLFVGTESALNRVNHFRRVPMYSPRPIN